MEIVVKVNQQTDVSSSLLFDIAWGLLNINSNTMNTLFQRMKICHSVYY